MTDSFAAARPKNEPPVVDNQRKAELEALNETGGVLFGIRNDPRVTQVGGLPNIFVCPKTSSGHSYASV